MYTFSSLHSNTLVLWTKVVISGKRFRVFGKGVYVLLRGSTSRAARRGGRGAPRGSVEGPRRNGKNPTCANRELSTPVSVVVGDRQTGVFPLGREKSRPLGPRTQRTTREVRTPHPSSGRPIGTDTLVTTAEVVVHVPRSSPPGVVPGSGVPQSVSVWGVRGSTTRRDPGP